MTPNGFFCVFCVKMWKAPLSRALREIKQLLCVQSLIFVLYKTNKFHVAVHLSSNRSQRTSKCGKNISDTLSLSPRVPQFYSYHILTSSVIYYWTDARQHGIYLLNRSFTCMFSHTHAPTNQNGGRQLIYNHST